MTRLTGPLTEHGAKRWTKQSKYRNVKTYVDDIRFDSKAEAERYMELKLLERAGIIHSLQRQVNFVLIPKKPPHKTRDTTYRADFVYVENGQTVVEDVKGVRTDVYKLKKDLMWTVHGIVIKEVIR